jgi:tetratricopeptide (TPR) repeat protein
MNGALPLRPPEAGPGSFVTDAAWEKLLKASPSRSGDWLTPYHLGVISFERGNNEAAAAYWEESLKRAENPWACRNLALAKIRYGDTQAALDYYRRALRLPGSQDQSFAEEYIPLLLTEGKEEEAETELNSYIHRAGSLEALSIPLLNAAAALALSRGDDAMLDKIFSIEQPHIREGNTTLVEIWTEREIRRYGGGSISGTQAEDMVRKALAEGSLTIPREIDFRMYTSTPQSIP